jgi:N-acetylneuraminic acid mutarotase
MCKNLPAITVLIIISLCSQISNAQKPQWAWLSGDTIANSAGNYGQQGAYYELNNPPARDNISKWRDTVGNLWLYGGRNFLGRNTTYFNDLWQYSTTLRQWRWVAGSQQLNTPLIVDTASTFSAINTPGAREAAATWTDATNRLWLFGGYAFSTNFFGDYFNDFWVFDIARGQWSRKSKSSIPNSMGRYGTKQIGDSLNVPATRELALTWQDSLGNFWLFGGSTSFDQRRTIDLNDLWKYDVRTERWIWMSGDSTSGITAVFGAIGVSSPGNKPGGREGSTSWTDSKGNFWLFGGSRFEYDTTGEDLIEIQNLYNDLWKYNPTTNEWTWVSGDSLPNQPASYGLKGIANATNKPGARDLAASWTDSTGNLWLFGGEGYTEDGGGSLNDVWKFDVNSNQWTWMDGEKTGDPNGVYGVRFKADSTYHPGGRTGSAIWSDRKRSIWLFGGNGNSSLDYGFLNDLWQYVDTSAALRLPLTVKIDSPLNNSIIAAGKRIALDAIATTEPGATIKKIDFFVGGSFLFSDSIPPYGTSSSDVEPGVYLLTATATDSRGRIANSDTVKLTIAGCTPSGAITAEGFTNIPGTQVSDLLANPAYPNSPSIVAQLPSLEYADVGTDYGGRLRGYICAPQTGNYVFSIAGDDQAGIFLSTDDDPAHANLIAYNISPVGFRQFNATPTQRSAPIRLLKGARYYIETLHKQSTGSNFMTVSWTLPDGTVETPISANRLSPLGSPPAPNAAPNFVAGMQSFDQQFVAAVAPNPSTNRFEVHTISKSPDFMSITVTDMLDRVMERRDRLTPNTIIRLGEKYPVGIYFLVIRQGSQQQRLKIIKE